MKLYYSNTMIKCLKNDYEIKKRFGNLFKRIKVCLSVLIAADNLFMVPDTSPTKRHKLSSGEWSISLNKNWRMIFKARNGSEPKTIDEIEIVDIKDYH